MADAMIAETPPDNPAAFPTHGVLSATTGRLMGDIGGLYEVGSYLLGRPIFTHELGYYCKPMAERLAAAHPELPTHATKENWQAVRDAFIAEHGETFALNPSLAGSLSDDENAISTLARMVAK